MHPRRWLLGGALFALAFGTTALVAAVGNLATEHAYQAMHDCPSTHVAAECFTYRTTTLAWIDHGGKGEATLLWLASDIPPGDFPSDIFQVGGVQPGMQVTLRMWRGEVAALRVWSTAYPSLRVEDHAGVGVLFGAVLVGVGFAGLLASWRSGRPKSRER